MVPLHRPFFVAFNVTSFMKNRISVKKPFLKIRSHGK